MADAPSTMPSMPNIFKYNNIGSATVVDNPNEFEVGDTLTFNITNSDTTTKYKGTILSYTFPHDCKVKIEAKGAKGGLSTTGGKSGQLYGYGALVSATFDFAQGDQLLILVGQAGTNYGATTSSDSSTGAGGGGTFIAKKVSSSSYKFIGSSNSNSTQYNGWYVEPLIIAAGGNGGRDIGYSGTGTIYNGLGFTDGTAEALGSTSTTTTQLIGGTFSKEIGSNSSNNSSYRYGRSFLQGGLGSMYNYARSSRTSYAGFGGGAANADDGNGGGGGGWVSGFLTASAKSYCAPSSVCTDKSFTAGDNDGEGSVTFTFLEVPNKIAFRIKKDTKFIKSNTAYIKQNSGTWKKAVEAYIKVPVYPTKLLLHGEELIDNSNYSIPLTNSGVVISETQSKFGGKSMYFNGQAYLKTSEIIPVNGDFTVDWWEYCTGNSATRFAQSVNGGCGGICAGGSANINSLYISSTGSSWNLSSGSVMFNTALNTWVHWALVRNGNTWTTYRNGIKFAQITGVGTIFTNSSGLVIGSFLYDANHYFVGYIDEFRISNIARWTQDFPPPTAPYIISEDIPYAVWKKAVDS